MTKPVTFLALLAVLCTNTYFSCEQECYTYPIPLALSNQHLTHLDNRGATAVELPSGAQGWLTAYGFRFSTQSQIKQPADTVNIECLGYYPDPTPSQVSIKTLTGTGNDYPPGADVSALFKYVFAEGDQYRSLSMLPDYLVGKWSYPGLYHCDFLLIQPLENPGWQQFELQISNSDLTKSTFVTDSIYLQ